MNKPAITLEIADGVGRLTLARPEKRNAVDFNFARDLELLAKRCASDPAIRTVMLTGQGRFFCVGGDIDAFAAAGDDAETTVGDLARQFHAGILTLATMDKPLVTAINGPAAGAGLGLAIMGDIVIAGASAHFTSAYTAVGLTPDGGASWWLPRLVGLRRAQDMVLTNRRVDAEEASAIGLITRVVPDEQLSLVTREAALALAAGPMQALARCRTLLSAAGEVDLATQPDREARSIAMSAGGVEGREGVAAFLAKRMPMFAANA